MKISMLIKMESSPKMEEKLETLVGTRLAEYCTANLMHPDFGVDFTCVLPPDNKGDRKEFYVYYKGAEKVHATEELLSLRVKALDIRRWLQKKYLTFLFYVDITNDDIYWINPFEQLFAQKSLLDSGSESLVIEIPKKNVLAKEAKALPAGFYEGMRQFNSYLFSGRLKRMNQIQAPLSEDTLSSKEIVVNEERKELTITYRSVVLHGRLPKMDQEGDCTIRLTKTAKNEDLEIRLTHKELLKLLYFGRETEAKLGMRKYIASYLEDIEQYLVDFGGIRTCLYQEEVDELNAVIDTFIKRYVATITDFLKQHHTMSFEPYRGDYRQFKLMQLDTAIWDKIQGHVQTHLTSNGSYDEGYIFTPYENIDRIGIDDQLGRELFSIYGYYVQSENDPKKIVVDVVWEYLGEYGEGNASEIAYNVADTYAFLVNELLPQFFTTKNTVEKKRFLKKKRLTVVENQTKEEIEKKVSVSKFKLTQYPRGNAELAATFDCLANYLKGKDFYTLKADVFEHLLESFDKLLRAELSLGGDFSKDWYQEMRKELLKEMEQLKIDQATQSPSTGESLAIIFSKLKAIVEHYRNSFEGKRMQENEMLSEFSDVIAEYNEDRLIHLLLS